VNVFDDKLQIVSAVPGILIDCIGYIDLIRHLVSQVTLSKGYALELLIPDAYPQL
jgi:hypothetical protein